MDSLIRTFNIYLSIFNIYKNKDKINVRL
jgi:hypothetical protein